MASAQDLPGQTGGTGVQTATRLDSEACLDAVRQRVTDETEFIRTQDRNGRDLAVKRGDEVDINTLVSLYEAFDIDQRTQGLPPVETHKKREWLATLAGKDGYELVAFDGEQPVGHATIVCSERETYELIIFIHPEYQGVGVGSILTKCLIGIADSAGIDRIWLMTEGSNRAAVGLFRNVGFETIGHYSPQVKMEFTF